MEDTEAEATPDERLDAAYKELRETLADDLLDKVRGSSPKFFEHLVVDLLVRMGYGGINASRAQVVGKSGDGGIDGVIPEDRLGLDMVYVQAKKWEHPVGPDEIRKFVGSLGEQKAHKGVFITSGEFTSGARTAAEKANARVVLIDGDRLAELMIDHGVGVTDHKPYVVKKLDSDYFDVG
ncbi:MAG: restriction endonuclease [Phycisphaerales bacterium]